MTAVDAKSSCCGLLLDTGATLERWSGPLSTLVDSLGRTLYNAATETEPSEMESATTADDNAIVATRQGDGEAFRGIVERYQDKVAALMRRFTRDERQLEELVQDVFVEAFTSLRSFHLGKPFYPWLRKIGVRVGYRFWKSLKRAKNEVPLENIAEVASEPRDMSSEKASETLHRLFAMLPPRDRVILTLIYLEGCSVAEAAKAAGWTVVMAKVQAHRARRRLQELIEKGLAEGWLKDESA